MGCEEEHRQMLISQLKTHKVTPSGRESIKQLETKLKQATERK